ncbi:DODA-type extradiol aromatic ring-opening family dioxygenase [Amycolatopsis pithecellobii]|uniref:Extradiol ring-cleavage dioxygenase class III enzyme subunit B domain-containing protein n=1 Tax=Amycolatopsis pithecellobii TaxID=664692 RepID=A0A6N7Z7C8_9PSEU|nr:hypothetical protein [Amycolatopsis pithecellobii]MTD57044.1 hypothetical protein [Amycolatopsis pithecellobii]
MATSIGGLATSHSPQLNTEPPVWRQRAEWDRNNPVFDFSVLRNRSDLPEDIEAQLTDEALQRNYDACQAAIRELGAAYAELAPDVVVIIGDDQHEMFTGDVIPAIAIYCDDTIDDIPRPLESLHVSQVAGEWAYHGTERVTRPTHGALGRHLVGSLTKAGFDITQIRTQPPERTIGHAYTFVQRRIMGERVVPIVPVMVNTDHVLSAPKPRRCWELGKAIRAAIDSFESDERVLIIGSGGLSHFKLDEALDRTVVDALLNQDVDALDKLPEDELILGTSEIRNWIIAAAALTDFSMSMIDYVAAYRSEAGTGCGMGFACWN